MTSGRASACDAVEHVTHGLLTTFVSDTDANKALAEAHGIGSLSSKMLLAKLTERPGVTLAQLAVFAPELGLADLAPDVAETVRTTARFSGYIERQKRQVARFRAMENLPIPSGTDFGDVRGLSNEVQEKLDSHRPRNLGQAGRISGITPAAVNALLVYLRRAG